MRDVLPVIVDCLTTGTPVSLSRWGDGEWHAILGHPGQNCDGQVYKAALRTALADVLCRQPRYLLGLQPLVIDLLGSEVVAWLARRHLAFDWVDGDLFVTASQAGTLTPFVSALSQRRTLLVGPSHLEALYLFPRVGHVIVPARNAFAVYASLERQVLAAVEKMDADVVVLSAGMSANLLVDVLARTHPAVSALDCGSLWEPYVGLVTRTYHRAILAREQAHT